MSEWPRVPLGDVTRQSRDPISPVAETEYNLLGLRMYGRGVYLRETVTTETSKAKTLYQARSGQFVYNRMFAWGGAFGVVPEALDGSFVSNEFPLFEAKPGELVIDFLRLYFQQPSVWSWIDEMSTGTTKSRNRWKESLFAAHEIALPSLIEQRRIVEVLAVVDAQIQALKSEQDALARVIDLDTATALSGLTASISLGEVTSTRSGPSFASGDVSDAPSVGTVPVVGIPNTKPDGTFDLSEVGHVSGLAASVRTVDESSLILIRTNGNRQRIGNVYLPPVQAHDHAVSAFQFLMKVARPEDREFVFWVLRDPRMQARMSAAASGTTGLGNLAAGWLNAASIPWSHDPAERATVVSRLRSQQVVADGMRSELATLREFRSALLTALFSQSISIPESYDALLHADASALEGAPA